MYDISWSSSDFNGSVTCANDHRPEHCTTLQRLVIQDRGGIYGEERWGNYSLRNLLLFIKIISWTSTLRLFQCDIHVEATEFYRWTRDPLLKQRDGNVPGYNIVSAKFYWGEGVLRSNFQRSVLFGGGGDYKEISKSQIGGQWMRFIEKITWYNKVPTYREFPARKGGGQPSRGPIFPKTMWIKIKRIPSKWSSMIWMLADTSAGTWIEKAQLPCWPPYSQQVLHQRWISGIHCIMQVTKHASEGSTLALKPGETLPEVQNRSISGPTKRIYVVKKIFKKTKKKKDLNWSVGVRTIQCTRRP